MRSIFFGLGSVLLTTACGSTAIIEQGTGGGGGGNGEGGSNSGGGGNGTGGDGSGGAPSCGLDAPGAAFTFDITNVGNRLLRLAFGCGKTIPIFLDTSEGPLGIAPGYASFCEVACESVYDGYENWGCSDCGPGVGSSLNPGETVTIPWDRRVFREHVAPAACSGHAENNSCGLGISVDPNVATGTLTVCNDGGGFYDGYCSTEAEEKMPFTIDLDATSVKLEVL